MQEHINVTIHEQQQQEQVIRNVLKAKRRSSVEINGATAKLLNLEEIISDMKKLAVSRKSKHSIFEGILIDEPEDKQHTMVTRQDTE